MALPTLGLTDQSHSTNSSSSAVSIEGSGSPPPPQAVGGQRLLVGENRDQRLGRDHTEGSRTTSNSDLEEGVYRDLYTGRQQQLSGPEELPQEDDGEGSLTPTPTMPPAAIPVPPAMEAEHEVLPVEGTGSRNAAGSAASQQQQPAAAQPVDQQSPLQQSPQPQPGEEQGRPAEASPVASSAPGATSNTPMPTAVNRPPPVPMANDTPDPGFGVRDSETSGDHTLFGYRSRLAFERDFAAWFEPTPEHTPSSRATVNGLSRSPSRSPTSEAYRYSE
ncbi:hypothetical protein C8Q73DRAFT_791415 [Cubamyces lactineus]|nr:hypothetical protein C8Q73DRAFT_791415 [Cubamyces lactineus]